MNVEAINQNSEKTNSNKSLIGIKAQMAAQYTAPEQQVVEELNSIASLTSQQQRNITARTIGLIEDSRTQAGNGSLFDQFLQEYGLSTAEGVTLMRLAEALIRTPDFSNSAMLVRDKLGSGDWDAHIANSSSMRVNLATAGMQLSSFWINKTGGVNASNRLARLGDKVLLTGIEYAMGVMSGHFVLGNTIAKALKKSKSFHKQGYTFSYDMLGEAAHTSGDAERYFQAYLRAAHSIQKSLHKKNNIKSAPSISVKLSALHPRYELSQKHDCVPQLTEKLVQLAQIAKTGNFGLTIDAEECDRLEVSLTIIEYLLNRPELKDWDGLGIVVQAYQKRAPQVIAWLREIAQITNNKLSIRLVKGAYWDMEIKRAQELGLSDYPVFTRKENTDLSYLACAKLLFSAPEWIYPQFATHNAQTAASIIELAPSDAEYEFQRLHGMGPELHTNLMKMANVKSRIYAPVGQYRDLLPYLVRRLLENGANSSFVNQMLDPEVPAEDLATSPFDLINKNACAAHPKIPLPTGHLGPKRDTSKGWDFTQENTALELEKTPLLPIPSRVNSIINGLEVDGEETPVICPSSFDTQISTASFANSQDALNAIENCEKSDWANVSPIERSNRLMKAASLLEEEADSFFGLCVKEAGKSLPDAIAEIREAVDFCRYYAVEAQQTSHTSRRPLGTVVCISPWNFPLAIFMGQITAALAMGNTVIAKPAETTPVIAYNAVKLLHRAGIPTDALQLILGKGSEAGATLTSSNKVHGICFTGSTNTAKLISKTLADNGRPNTPLIAETGGMNAMIVDSTALLEQCVSDVVSSAFQSAGQRCSACRIVCVQDSIADDFITMLSGAMDLLNTGDPAQLSTDVGPVIDQSAFKMLQSYIEEGKSKWKTVGQTQLFENAHNGYYIPPTAFEIPCISELKEEKFGPILHIVRYSANKLEDLISEINALGYGLTLGAHTRIDARVESIAAQAKVGNLYINRNQIGAVVGVQPFGGEGLSGTGPKAGGPLYLLRLSQKEAVKPPERNDALLDKTSSPFDASILLGMRKELSTWSVEKAKSIVNFNIKLPSIEIHLPGPTGESNTLSIHARGILVCYAETPNNLHDQFEKTLLTGNGIIVAIPDALRPFTTELKSKYCNLGIPKKLINIQPDTQLKNILAQDIDGAVVDGKYSQSVADYLCRKEGPILPCLSLRDDIERFVIERTVTIDTTAAGGNASLLAM